MFDPYYILAIPNFTPALLSKNGHVFGYFQDDQEKIHAAIWQEGEINRLANFDLEGITPLAMNDQGLIVGHKMISEGIPHAFSWHDGIFTDLGPGKAFDVNNDGLIVGVDANTQMRQAVVWKNGACSVIGDPGTCATSVNDHDCIVGYWEMSDDKSEAVLWNDGHIQILKTNTDTHYNEASCINNAGQIVGTANYDSGPPYTEEMLPPKCDLILWQNGLPETLPMCKGYYSCYDPKINSQGTIAGWATCGSSIGVVPWDDVGFVYQNGKMEQLDSLIPGINFLSYVRAISDQGQILADGQLVMPRGWRH